jgi:hypothetical protein
MVKSRMNGAGINQMGHSKLLDIPQALKIGVVNQVID